MLAHSHEIVYQGISMILWVESPSLTKLENAHRQERALYPISILVKHACVLKPRELTGILLFVRVSAASERSRTFSYGSIRSPLITYHYCIQLMTQSVSMQFCLKCGMKHDTIYFATTCSALKIFFGSINTLLLSALKDQKLLLTES